MSERVFSKYCNKCAETTLHEAYGGDMYGRCEECGYSERPKFRKGQAVINVDKDCLYFEKKFRISEVFKLDGQWVYSIERESSSGNGTLSTCKSENKIMKA